MMQHPKHYVEEENVSGDLCYCQYTEAKVFARSEKCRKGTMGDNFLM